MKKYSSFNSICLKFIGFSFLNQETFNSGGLKKSIGLIASVVFFIHSLLFTINNFEIAMDIAPSPLVLTFFCFQIAIKIIAILKHQKQMWLVNMEIRFLSSLISNKNMIKMKKDLKKNTKIIKFSWIFPIVGSALICIVPFLVLIFLYYTRRITYRKLPYSFSYPFNPYNGYFGIFYIYEISISSLVALSMLAIDGFILSTLGKLAILFRNLGYDFKDIINEHEFNESRTIAKLIEKIKMHNRLIKVTSKFLSFIDIALLANLISSIGIMFYVIYLTVVEEMTFKFFITKLIGFSQVFALIHQVCYFGEKLSENVSFM